MYQESESIPSRLLEYSTNEKMPLENTTYTFASNNEFLGEYPSVQHDINPILY